MYSYDVGLLVLYYSFILVILCKGPTKPARHHSARSTPSPISTPSRNISSPELQFIPTASNFNTTTVDHTVTNSDCNTHHILDDIHVHVDTPIENQTDDFHKDTISKPAVDNYPSTVTENVEPSPPTTNSQPAIPPRPYLPPRPFPPRSSPAHKNQGNNPPPKPKRTRQYPKGTRNASKRSPNQANSEHVGTHKAHVDTSMSHDLTPRSHDPPNRRSDGKYNHAIMMSVEDPLSSFPLDAESDDKANETSSISITGHGVQFAMSADSQPSTRPSEGSPDYQTSHPATLDITAEGVMTGNDGDDGRADTDTEPAVITAPKTLFEIKEDQDQVRQHVYAFHMYIIYL